MLVMSEKKLAFKCYIFGYLNCYVNNLYLKDSIDPNLSYKAYKLGLTLSYLKLPSNNEKNISVIIRMLSYFEVLFYIISETIQFMACSIILLFSSHYTIKNRKFFLGHNANKPTLSVFFDSIGLKKSDLTIITLPFVHTEYKDYNSAPIYCSLSMSDLVKSYIYSIELSVFQKMKYGWRDFLFRSDSSFVFFLVYFFVQKCDKSNDFFFVNQIDRWAHLFGNLNANTYMIQHGKQLMKIPAIRIGSIKCAYYIDDSQRVIFEKTLFKNKPIARYRANFYFTANNKLLHNGLKDVLLICNDIYVNREIKVLQICANKKLNLYLKPHPLDSMSRYDELKSVYNCITLGKVDYPKVDLVISYDSTLADDYEKVGAKVIRYDDENFEEELNRILE